MTDYVFSSTSSATDLVGQQLGDYRIRHRLGQGGMAEVYLGEQQSLCRSVAVKVLKPHLACDENYVKRFHREAQAAASLVHANIVQIHEVNCIDDYHVIVQEYVAGQNLKQILQHAKRLDPAVALFVTRQVSVALAKAHSRGLVHRDIKPENILISTDAMVKVADFGLARVTDDRRKVELTEVGLTMGTPLYMSPEQVEGSSVDPRSDIYSLGVTLYHMLTGKPPFDGETPLIVAVKHLKEDPPALAHARPELPRELCRLVHRMLEKDPGQRFGSIAELAEELSNVPVEGPPPTWPQQVGLTDADLDVNVSTARFAETQQLATAIQGKAERSKLPIWIGWLVAGLIGAAVAWIIRPADPLGALPTVESASNDTDSGKSIVQQFGYAASAPSENAWQQVIAFPPPLDEKDLPIHQYHVLRARQKLARIYLNEGKYDLALDEFQVLTSQNATELEFRAFGMAGEAITYYFLKEREQTELVLSGFTPELSKKLEEYNPEMAAMLQICMMFAGRWGS